MSSSEKKLYEFDGFVLDPHQRVLLRDGKNVPLTPKVFETMLVLLRRAGSTVSTEELLGQVWADTVAGKNNLDQNVFLLRKALGDTGPERRYVETVPKLGYRFVAEVREVAVESVETAPLRDDQADGAACNEGVVAPRQERQAGPAGERPNASRGARRFGEAVKAGQGRTPLLLAASLIAVLGGIYGAGKLVGGLERRPRTMKIARIVGAEKSLSAAISPDGKYAAQVVAAADERGVELRQLATNSSVQLVSPAAGDYFGLSFSRDGNYVYFVRQGKAEPVSTLYRVPSLGGDVKKIAERVDSPVSFSPDGRRFAFVRNLREEQTSLKGTLKESALIVADAESGEERVARRRVFPEFYSDAGPSWSPDGKLIACPAGAGSSGADTHMTVVGVDAADGSERALTSVDWSSVGQSAWLPDGSGLIVTAVEAGAWSQIWNLAYPTGEARRVTDDLDEYSGISLSADASTLITTRTENRYNLWATPGTDYRQVKQLTSGGGHIYRRVAWSPDGRIVFPSNATGFREIWIAGADGSGLKQLTFDKGNDLLPSVSPDGRYIVYSSDRAGKPNIWRMGVDGSNAKQLTRGEQDFGPRCSTDGRWVLYTSASAGRETMWRVPIEGGEPEQVTDKAVVGPDVSPDGKFIAAWYKPAPDSPRKIAVFAWEGGEPIKVFEALPPQLHPVRWSRDGRSLIYVVTRDGVSNLWGQPVGGGASQQLTDFKSEVIEGFDVAPDGRLVVSRGYVARDVVTINDFR
jgi:Tol biopolymer transport system component/DNA-binding winged helix-turn-helix (wHTH) protein